MYVCVWKGGYMGMRNGISWNSRDYPFTLWIISTTGWQYTLEWLPGNGTIDFLRPKCP